MGIKVWRLSVEYRIDLLIGTFLELNLLDYKDMDEQSFGFYLILV